MPNARLALIRGGQHELKTAARKGMVMVCALILIAVLALDSFHTSVHFMWAMMPVIALLVVVVLFGALGMFSALRRAFSQAHLVVDAEKGEVSGFPSHAFWPRLRNEPLQKLQALILEVRRGAGSNPKDLKTWATLELKLEDGTRLEAPDAWGPDADFEATEALLIPLGETLSSLSRKPLEITRLGSKENAGAT